MTRLCPVRWTLNGNTISTTINITAINQPVSIMLPPASQTGTTTPSRYMLASAQLTSCAENRR